MTNEAMTSAAMENATIAAIASPPGAGARGIVRISGPAARTIVRAMWLDARTDGRDQSLWETRGVFFGRIDDGRGTQPAMCVWMPGPRSYTGEDVAELHSPGSPPLLAAVLTRVLELGARAAEPGEFTRRAFENGRMDLTRAEGVADLISATDAADARAAGALLLGGLGTRIANLRDALEDARALCEASLDFDEADTGHVATEEIAAGVRAIRSRVDEALEFERARARATGRARIVLCGAPNAGKSALFNALTRAVDEALAGPDFADESSRWSGAIVNDLAGTTRDTLEADADLGGVEVRLLDTPGLDATAVGIDAEAQRLAREHVASADLALLVVDATRGDELSAQISTQRALLPRLVTVVLAWNKVDLAAALPVPVAHDVDVTAVIAVSAREGIGIDALRRALAARLENARDGEIEGASAAIQGASAAAAARERAARHLRGLSDARTHLDEALTGIATGEPLDLTAETLRRASAALDEIDGRTTPEDLLDRIFARFCLGK